MVLCLPRHRGATASLHVVQKKWCCVCTSEFDIAVSLPLFMLPGSQSAMVAHLGSSTSRCHCLFMLWGQHGAMVAHLSSSTSRWQCISSYCRGSMALHRLSVFFTGLFLAPFLRRVAQVDVAPPYPTEGNMRVFLPQAPSCALFRCSSFSVQENPPFPIPRYRRGRELAVAQELQATRESNDLRGA